MDRNSLSDELKGIIRSIFDMPDLELDDDSDLINSELEMDSIDILEMELALKKKYDIRLETLPRESLRSISSIANFIMDYKKAR